jgi:4-diphosphocytidyl-2-C-methyl-D-erythritol kinase
LALDALADAGLSGEALRGMAEKLGSDVPFFLTGGAALVSGRGDVIRPIPMPQSGHDRRQVVLVNPGFSSGTREAFALLDAGRAAPCAARPGGNPGAEALIAAFGAAPASWPYGNDFLPVFLAEGPGAARKAYGDILRDLAALGAEFSGLSGAGSTCFGIFTDTGEANRAVKVLSKRWDQVWNTFFLARNAHAVVQ